MKKLVVTPISNTIWWATVNDEKGIITGNKVDVTDNAIQAVLDHLTGMSQFKKDKFGGYVYDRTHGGTFTICAYDDTHITVAKKLFDELTEYKRKYEELIGEVDENNPNAV